MFSNLKQGSQLWIFHSDAATPFIEVGTVENINGAIPLYYPNLPAYPVDLSVRVGEKTTAFQRLPANAESANVTDNTGESVTIACTKEAIGSEVDMLIRKSADIINSVEYHKNRLAVLGELAKQLNPELAEKEAQAKEISDLREQLQQMREMIAEFKGETSS